jgi:hypothetical protein
MIGSGSIRGGDGGIMDEVQADAVKRRRRKASRRKAASWPEYFRSADFARHLFVFMTLLAIAYAGTFLHQTRQATFFYNPFMLGNSQSEVRYVLGPPTAIEGGGSVYRYTEKAREIVAKFSPEGRLVSVRCGRGAEQPSSCRDVRGIRIGTTEDQIWAALGSPSRESFSGNDKTIHYDGMGLTFQLRLFKVREIEMREGASVSGYLPRAVWAMIP